MNTPALSSAPAATRRDLLKAAGKTAAATALAASVARPGYTAESNEIKVALIGCGGRGTGAASQALSTAGPVKLVAMGDVFPQRLENSLKILQGKHGDRVDVPPDRQFIGMDAFKKIMDSLDKGSLVLLTTPPAFRPLHVEYAIEKNLHVFMEKSFGVDAPGVRRILKAGEAAKQKNLKVASGLMSRHYLPLEQAVEKIHGGLIGDVITAWAYREHHPVGLKPRPANSSELAHQIANYSCFTWLNGTFFLDWLIHNIDICCWVKDAWPVSVQGMGGRQTRTAPDQLFDHYSAEYTFPDGTRLLAQGRHMENCWGFFGDVIQGAKGSAVLGEGVSDPRIYKGHKQSTEDIIWRYEGPKCDHYQREHDLLFDAIRNDKPYNESERAAKACLTSIMGRMACESGKLITWDDAFNSTLELAPGLDQLTWDGTPPVQPDANGKYPIAMPGHTQVL